MDEQALETAAKALWESKPHKMLTAGGYPTDWESQCRSIKRDIIREARTVIQAYEQSTKTDESLFERAVNLISEMPIGVIGRDLGCHDKDLDVILFAIKNGYGLSE